MKNVNLPFWTIFPIGGMVLFVLLGLVVVLMRGCSSIIDTATPIATATDASTATATVIPTNTAMPTATATVIPTNTAMPTATPVPLPQWAGFCWDLYQLETPDDALDQQNWLNWTCSIHIGMNYGLIPYRGKSWVEAQSYGVYLNGQYLPEGDSVDIERCPWDPTSWCVSLK